ncbi:hypothetical protein TcasGA2_TC009248 [Tribolium castaneum]|uniref:Uncharacterized protein n=1 Tax=Tribolium castaneum TaxID=7070 RepID=D6WSG3_TRICA|nr:hypothetical protein TcasGA2_TC009248 [Tribolium castaneum]
MKSCCPALFLRYPKVALAVLLRYIQVNDKLDVGRLPRFSSMDACRPMLSLQISAHRTVESTPSHYLPTAYSVSAYFVSSTFIATLSPNLSSPGCCQPNVND